MDFSQRTPSYGEDKLFLERWSPRSFRREKLSSEILDKIFGAVRWSQSCFNEQPWLFVTESGDKDREVFEDLLADKNREWARNASLIGFSFARRHFSHNGKANRWAAFDTGAAWMALTLQARLLGLYTHGMAGIKKDDVYPALKISSEEYEVICGFVIGVPDAPEKLPEELRAREKPSGRRGLEEIWQRGVF